MPHEFQVILASEIEDHLDRCFSPLDGIVAIDQITLELPLLHPRPVTELRRRLSRRLNVFHGRYDWYPLGFSYVQIGHELHILDLWEVEEKRRWFGPRFAVVLGTDNEFNRNYELRRHTAEPDDRSESSPAADLLAPIHF